MSPVSRRDVFRGLGLSVLAVGAVGLLDACGEDTVEPSGHDTAALTVARSDAERAPLDEAAVAGGAASMHALGAGLWGRLSGDDGNLAISPFSVAVALGMAANGARGRTLDEMLDVLAVDSVEVANAGYNSVAQYVESLAGPVQLSDEETLEVVIDTANSLFGQQGFTWEPGFLDALASSYGAGMQQVDYAATDAARATINSWTAEQTHDKIPELIPQNTLSDLTRLVLVNALYLKANWGLPFEESATSDGDFHLADGSTVSVPMMHSGEVASALAGDGWSAARLWYAGNGLAMTVVLPDSADDIDTLITDGTVAEIVTTSPTGPVDLTMPRWTFRVPTELTDALTAMGMATAFGSSADFSGMTSDDQLSIGGVVHEVFIAVDEHGTEAAAATAVMAVGTGMPMEVPELVLDRPFLFVIHDVEVGTPLFVGRVGDPS